MKKLILLAALVVAAPALGVTKAHNRMIHGSPVSVVDYGATPDDGTDDSAALAAAFAATPTGGVLLFPPGTYDGSLDVTGKRFTITGRGATLNSASANGAIYKTDHNNKLTVVGLRFTGTAIGIKYVTTTSSSTYDDFSFEGLRFENSDYGIYTDGPREGRIINCSFEGLTNKGIYRVRTVNTDVIGCYWHNTVYGVHDDGDGTPYSAGLKVLGGTMIGAQYGILSTRVDWLSVTGVMIDYCDNPLRLIGVDIADISGNYITTRTLNPAVYVDRYDVSYPPREIRIRGNAIASNVDDVASDAVVMKYVSTGLFEGNSVTFWWRYGLDLSNSTNVRIERNKFSSDPSSTAPTKYSVYESAGGSNSNLVMFNELNQPASTLTAFVAQNRGYVTEANGEAVAGGGVTTYNVAHGCSYTPSKNDIQLTPTNAEAAGKNPYISAVDATNITIGFTSATAGSAGVAWSVRKQ